MAMSRLAVVPPGGSGLFWPSQVSDRSCRVLRAKVPRSSGRCDSSNSACERFRLVRPMAILLANRFIACVTRPARPSTPEAETNPHQYRRPATTPDPFHYFLHRSVIVLLCRLVVRLLTTQSWSASLSKSRAVHKLVHEDQIVRASAVESLQSSRQGRSLGEHATQDAHRNGEEGSFEVNLAA